MAKKNNKNDAQKKDVTMSAPYKVTAWAGMPQYCCLLCPFDTLHEDAIFDHIANVHFVKRIDPLANLPTNMPGEKINEEDPKEKADGIYEIDLKEDQHG